MSAPDRSHRAAEGERPVKRRRLSAEAPYESSLADRNVSASPASDAAIDAAPWTGFPWTPFAREDEDELDGSVYEPPPERKGRRARRAPADLPDDDESESGETVLTESYSPTLNGDPDWDWQHSAPMRPPVLYALQIAHELRHGIEIDAATSEETPRHVADEDAGWAEALQRILDRPTPRPDREPCFLGSDRMQTQFAAAVRSLANELGKPIADEELGPWLQSLAGLGDALLKTWKPLEDPIGEILNADDPSFSIRELFELIGRSREALASVAALNAFFRRYLREATGTAPIRSEPAGLQLYTQRFLQGIIKLLLYRKNENILLMGMELVGLLSASSASDYGCASDVLKLVDRAIADTFSGSPIDVRTVAMVERSVLMRIEVAGREHLQPLRLLRLETQTNAEASAVSWCCAMAALRYRNLAMQRAFVASWAVWTVLRGRSLPLVKLESILDGEWIEAQSEMVSIRRITSWAHSYEPMTIDGYAALDRVAAEYMLAALLEPATWARARRLLPELPSSVPADCTVAAAVCESERVSLPLLLRSTWPLVARERESRTDAELSELRERRAAESDLLDLKNFVAPSGSAARERHRLDRRIPCLVERAPMPVRHCRQVCSDYAAAVV